MRLRVPSGIWELFVPRLGPGARYKFDIVGAGGMRLPRQGRSGGAAGRAARRPRRRSWRIRRLVALDRRALDGEPRRAAVRDRADLDLRGPYRILAAAGRGRPRLAVGPRHRAPHPLPRRSGLHAISSCCRSPSIRSAARGAISRSACSRPAPRFGPPEAFARFVDALHAANIGVIARLGAGALSRPTRTAWRASTARRSTSISIRAKASTATGTPTSTISAGARFRAS